MSRSFQYKMVPSSWLVQEDHRLNAKPYFSGAIEAKLALEKFPCELLGELTKNGKKGIFNGPRFSRVYVDDAEYGIKLLSGADILQNDLSHSNLIAKWQAQSMPEMVLEEGTILISSYGTIGRCAYTREDMTGMIGSDNVLKVIPDASKVLPGYLFAFISSRFGTPLVIKGEGGSVITFLDPSRMYTLPVPRLGNTEKQVHDIIENAAKLRVEANKLLAEATEYLEEEIAGGSITWDHIRPQSFSVEAKLITNSLSRLDAFHHIGFVGEAEKKARVPLIEISSIADVLRPPIFKRVHVQEGGYEFLGGADVMTMDQKSDDRISAKTKNIDKFIVKKGHVLFQCVGQRYGIFGRPTLANRNLIGKAVSEHQIRIIPYDMRDAGYISIYLATGFGLRFLLKHSSGTSIPVLQEDGAKKIKIYWPEEKKRHDISAIAERAWDNRAQAVELEQEARTFVERAIEEGGR